MTDDEEKIAVLVREMAEIYGRRLSDGAIKRWVEMWSPFDSSRLEIAINDVAETSEYMPTVALLRKAVLHLYPTQLAMDVANTWASQNPLSGLPSQADIDEMLVGWGKPAGAVQRKHLFPR